MGCGASSQSVPTAGAVPPEPETTQRADTLSCSRGYWERQKYAATQWTVNSTMAIAKAAMENGMPEPPETFFQTQDRLVEFFAKHGELKVLDPQQVRLFSPHLCGCKAHPERRTPACRWWLRPGASWNTCTLWRKARSLPRRT